MASLTVMRETPRLAKACRTVASLGGWITASMSFMGMRVGKGQGTANAEVEPSAGDHDVTIGFGRVGSNGGLSEPASSGVRSRWAGSSE